MARNPYQMDEIRALKRRLRELLGPVELYLFGSRARGDFYPDSDYDLAIVAPAFDGKDELERYDLIRGDLREIFGATPVDVVLYTPEEFEQGAEGFLPSLIEDEGIRM
jgi:predicted nucleotidyltransferase